MDVIFIFAAMLAAVTGAAIMLARRQHQNQRARHLYEREQCTRCGYDIRFNVGRCPECGDDLTHQAVRYWSTRIDRSRSLR